MSRYGGRDVLFNNGYRPLDRTVNWDDEDDDEDETQHHDVGAVRQTQANMLEQQDRGLEALSEVISRQKNLAQVIGNEVEYQNELIDDITDHVDRTRDRISDQTNRVRVVDRKDSTCRYWVIIMILLTAIIIISIF